MMWVVEWREGGRTYHTIRAGWRRAMETAWYVRFRWDCPVKVMSEATYMGGSRV